MNIPPQEIPKDIDYQLVTVSVGGQRTPGRLVEFEKTGWRRVPVGRHPSIKSVDPKWIEVGGQVLVERPKYLTERAKIWEQDKADAQLLSVPISVVVGSRFREINMKATGKRKTTIKEFFVLRVWRLRVWLRDKWAEWRS